MERESAQFSFCGASTLVPHQHYFSVSKTADFFNYPQTKGCTKKEKCIPSGSFKHQRIRDPHLLIGCEAAKWKEKGEEHMCLIGTRSPPKQTCPLRTKWNSKRRSKGKKGLVGNYNKFPFLYLYKKVKIYFVESVSGLVNSFTVFSILLHIQRIRIKIVLIPFVLNSWSTKRWTSRACEGSERTRRTPLPTGLYSVISNNPII